MVNSSEISWKRIGAEAIAIVGSILLAFSIDAWWSDRQEHRESMLLLAALRVEFVGNIELIDTELKYRKAVKAEAEKLLGKLIANTEIEPNEISPLLGNLVWWGKADLSIGAINSLLLSGKLSLIDDPQLRQRLASIPSAYSRIARNEDQDYETFKNVLMPYLYENASLPQISNSLSGRPGVGDFALEQEYPEPAIYDYSNLIADPKFEGILTHKIWDQNDAIMGYVELRENLNGVVGLIDEIMQE